MWEGLYAPTEFSLPLKSGHKAPPTYESRVASTPEARLLRPSPPSSVFTRRRLLRHHQSPPPRLRARLSLRARALDTQRATLESADLWHVRTWVVMPDHLHVLFTLGPNSTLAEVLRLFKGRLTPSFRPARLSWQEGYYDHLMRPDEDRLPVFLYIFLNPYRANLVAVTEQWAGYFCSAEDWEWFGPLTNSDVPFPEWLQ